MADDNDTPTPDSTDDTGTDGGTAPATGDEQPLGEPGIKALRAERERAKQLEQDLKDATARLQEIADAEKSDIERAQEAATAAESRATEAEQQLMRLQVAAEKGLTPEAVKRLTGSTREELEADAEELLQLLGSNTDKTPPPGGRPTRLVNGNGPGGDDGFDPAALADRIAQRNRY